MWIIDRFEETIAVIETDDGMTEIPRSQILAVSYTHLTLPTNSLV